MAPIDYHRFLTKLSHRDRFLYVLQVLTVLLAKLVLDLDNAFSNLTFRIYTVLGCPTLCCLTEDLEVDQPLLMHINSTQLLICDRKLLFLPRFFVYF